MGAIALAVPIVLGVIFLALLAHFALGAWKGGGAFAITDRWAVLTRFASAVASCAIATLIVNWTVMPGAVWLVGIVLLALGIAGVALRWSDLPWLADGSRPSRIVGIAADLLISALFIGAALA